MRIFRSSIFIVVSVLSLAAQSATSIAGPSEAYMQSLNLAAHGHDAEALASLSAAAEALPAEQPWRLRMTAALELIQMKQLSQVSVDTNSSNPYLALSSAYAGRSTLPKAESTWPATIAATLIPGAGHALQGRWSDALTAALMVWPILILTLWAAKRRMGPVTVFFALITLWLWSGTVFSAISLAERGNIEFYTMWWQGLWHASGLPGRPW